MRILILLLFCSLSAKAQYIINPYVFGTTSGFTPDTASFNMSLTAISVSGWNNLYGDPEDDTLSIVDATTGIGISTRAPSRWIGLSGAAASQTGGETTANPSFIWPSNLVLTYHFSNDIAVADGEEQYEVTGLDALGWYTVQIMGSRDNSAVSQASRNCDYIIKHNGTRIVSSPFNVKQNTANLYEITNIQATSDGKIWIGGKGSNNVTSSVYAYFGGIRIIQQEAEL